MIIYFTGRHWLLLAPSKLQLSLLLECSHVHNQMSVFSREYRKDQCLRSDSMALSDVLMGLPGVISSQAGDCKLQQELQDDSLLGALSAA